MSAPREVIDSRGRWWTLFECGPENEAVLSKRPTPQGSRGWLCARHGEETRWLLQIQGEWRELEDAAILWMIHNAGPLHRTRG